MAYAEAAGLNLDAAYNPVWTGQDGLFSGAKSGDILVDMTTSTPKLAEKLARMGQELGIGVLDAPVSGGDIGAKNGTLSIMVGLGTGVMGTGMINNLLAAKHDVIVYNRTREKADDVIANGARWADSPAAVAQAADITFTMVGYPKDVEPTVEWVIYLVGVTKKNIRKKSGKFSEKTTK
ncbi:hypothetical protein GQS40_13240|uniref:6-phosphogluconate dehydrogenase NADP-binding domain-containing protein n=1 Tax=Leuconostoc lactis TaxID=1246 RepID=A0A6L7A8V5_LEULA|nr:hypothetical protein [Leuconostoc lactis]